jgi:uncharacterized oxidoreductase
MMRLDGKRALITGGASGIGLALTRAMVAAGAEVHVTGRDQTKLDRVAAEHDRVTGHVCDVVDDDAVRKLKDTMIARGGIDVLINNAGVMALFNVAGGYPLGDQIQEINIDAVGPVRMVYHFLPSMLDRASTIINVTSGLAYVPYAKAPVYSAAKAFVHAYTMCLREQLRGSSVRVVELLPPVVDTPLAEGIETPFPRMPPEKLAAALMSGLRRGKTEIAPGISGPLGWMARLSPGIAFWQLNK